MPRKPLTELERKERKAQRNAAYYAANKERILQSRDPMSPSRAERRAKHHPKWLAEIQEAAHPDLMPLLQYVEELGLAAKLLPSEMALIEELVVIITTAMEATERGA
jgi:hypothetical protein